MSQHDLLTTTPAALSTGANGGATSTVSEPTDIQALGPLDLTAAQVLVTIAEDLHEAARELVAATTGYHAALEREARGEAPCQLGDYITGESHTSSEYRAEAAVHRVALRDRLSDLTRALDALDQAPVGDDIEVWCIRSELDGTPVYPFARTLADLRHRSAEDAAGAWDDDYGDGRQPDPPTKAAYVESWVREEMTRAMRLRGHPDDLVQRVAKARGFGTWSDVEWDSLVDDLRSLIPESDWAPPMPAQGDQDVVEEVACGR